MNRPLRVIWAIISSRALSPFVIGVFLLIYIVLAFITDDTLVALMEYTRTNALLVVLLALVPLNSVCRMLKEAACHVEVRRALAGKAAGDLSSLFDEAITLSVSPSLEGLRARLAALGYRTSHGDTFLAAWRGSSIFPARALFLIGTFCLFTGILLSLTTRTSHRMSVVEGEPLPTAKGGGGVVQRIDVKPGTGSILATYLGIEVAPSDFGDAGKVFGLYPPSLYRGYFVYPRYLGIASVIRFSAPDLGGGYEKQHILNIYPAGKEDKVDIPGSSYRIVCSMVQPADGSNPYVTGHITYLFRLMKGKEVLFAVSSPAGTEVERNGYRLAFLDSRRMVITDFIQDYGVLFVWGAALFFLAAGCAWLPIRLLRPRREMLFMVSPVCVQAFSRAEGGGRRHSGVFHEALDLLEGGMPERPPFDGEPPEN